MTHRKIIIMTAALMLITAGAAKAQMFVPNPMIGKLDYRSTERKLSDYKKSAENNVNAAQQLCENASQELSSANAKAAVSTIYRQEIVSMSPSPTTKGELRDKTSEDRKQDAERVETASKNLAKANTNLEDAKMSYKYASAAYDQFMKLKKTLDDSKTALKAAEDNLKDCEREVQKCCNTDMQVNQSSLGAYVTSKSSPKSDTEHKADQILLTKAQDKYNSAKSDCDKAQKAYDDFAKKY